MIIVQTPLRASLFGGGTDFPDFYKEEGGCALTMALNKYIYVIVKSRFDKNVRLTYTKAELVKNSKSLRHDIVRECLKYLEIDNGIEVITVGDVPSGTGLASSSAVTVGVLKALYAFIGQEVGANELAEDACTIEILKLNKPIGVQDQYIAAFGGFRFFEFTKKGVKSRKIPIGKLNEHLLMFYTGVTRNADKILAKQKKNITQKKDILLMMKKLAYTAVKELEKGNYDKFGKLLDDHWQLKKQMATSISNPMIDKWYEKAKEAGSTGGKILGAGGGGFLLLYCPEGTKENVRAALSKLTELPVDVEPDGAKVVLNYRT